MICLKNRTFAVSQTTGRVKRWLCPLLWFAWKIVLLQYRKQLTFKSNIIPRSCDLLEKSYFCSIANNPHHGRTMAKAGCDLLEKSYFCSIANNVSRRRRGGNLVVICLKNRTFAVSQTTWRSRRSLWSQLWFAWKIVLLQYRKQQQTTGLGSFIVVICLKNRTFAVSQTTSWVCMSLRILLWFAWKIVLLQYRKQQPVPDKARALVVICLKNRTFAVSQTTVRKKTYICRGCDLLEKSYFCSIANNIARWRAHCSRVVICLKNRTFAVSQTT